MGKKFPRITNLKDNPSLYRQTLGLINNSFHYSSGPSFEIDFAPLMDKSNHHNCYVLTGENDEVLAHVGVKDRILRVHDQDFTVSLLGGIAVDKMHRGQGLFQELFSDVMAEKRGDAAALILWSDQETLYKKYGFQLCGSQYELTKTSDPEGFVRTQLSNLSEEQFSFVKTLYKESFQKTYLTVERTDSDWEQLKAITTADVFINETGYFMKNKGHDLTGIIYEYGARDNLENLLGEARKVGKVWTGTPIIETEVEQYQYMMCPGDLRIFISFIRSYTNGLFEVRNINVMKQEVFFDFNGETLMLTTEEFLRGVFGPKPFEELGDIPTLFISGLDSI